MRRGGKLYTGLSYDLPQVTAVSYRKIDAFGLMLQRVDRSIHIRIVDGLADYVHALLCLRSDQNELFHSIAGDRTDFTLGKRAIRKQLIQVVTARESGRHHPPSYRLQPRLGS